MLASGFSLHTHCIIRFISVPFFLLFLCARLHTVSKPRNKLEKQAFYSALSHLIILECCKRVDQYSSGFSFRFNVIQLLHCLCLGFSAASEAPK